MIQFILILIQHRPDKKTQNRFSIQDNNIVMHPSWVTKMSFHIDLDVLYFPSSKCLAIQDLSHSFIFHCTYC